MKKKIITPQEVPATYILKIVEAECWNCSKQLKIPFVDNVIGPTHYKPELIKIANENGTRIENRFSHTVKESYNANVCPHCNQIIGDFYLHDYWYNKEIKALEVSSDLIIPYYGM